MVKLVINRNSPAQHEQERVLPYINTAQHGPTSVLIMIGINGNRLSVLFVGRMASGYAEI